jgi:hypothetical protein
MPSPAGGYGVPPSPGGYGAPLNTGYTSSPATNMYGGGYPAPTPSPGYGMNFPSTPVSNMTNYGNPSPANYGTGYGAPTPAYSVSSTTYNAPTSTPSYGGMVPAASVTVSTTTIPVAYMPTFSYPPNDPHSDAVRLRKSMKGLGTDDSVLINIMTHRSKAQLQQIAEVYIREFKHSLERDIAGDTSGNYCILLCDLLKPVHAYKVESIRKSVKGIGTRESILIDVLTQSSNHEIAAIKSLYPDVERNISNDTSGNFRKVLLDLLKGNRQETNVIDDSKAEHTAHEIYKAGEYRLGTNDSKFVDIMTTYSPYFLDRVNYHYTRIYHHSLYKAIEKETSGDYCRALIACCKPPDVYFADRLKQATRGIGTDDWGLIYIFAVHDKAQLKHISKVYTDRGHGNLALDIERDTSGNYRKTLVSLLA